MKKKLLYTIPVLLAILNVTPLALYKDDVGLSGKPPVLESLTPEHWHLLQLNVSASAILSNSRTTGSQNNSDNTNASNTFTKNASFKGFPFGAYFSKHSRTVTSSYAASTDVAAWSWLWTTVDILLLIIATFVAFRLNKKAGNASVAPIPQPTTTAPIIVSEQPAPSQSETVSQQYVHGPTQPSVVITPNSVSSENDDNGSTNPQPPVSPSL